MPSENRASLTALVNSKQFIGVQDFVINLPVIWGVEIAEEPWNKIFLNWLYSKVQEFQTCQENGNLITVVVV